MTKLHPQHILITGSGEGIGLELLKKVLLQNKNIKITCHYHIKTKEFEKICKSNKEIINVMNADFANIQHRINTHTVSQRGQKYLHIHPHGSKGSKTRAFGFTNKFVTKLVSIQTEKPLTTKGNSFYIDKKHF